MKFNLLFLLVISLTAVLSLIDISPVSAQRVRVQLRCPGDPRCPILTGGGTVRGGGRIPEVSQKLDALLRQGNFAGGESLLLNSLGEAEKAQNLIGQAAAHQALGDVYVRMNKPDLASTHLKNAETLYQRLGNSQGSSEVKVQLRQIELQQIQIRQIQIR